jgi:hypothetical protein
MTHDNHIGSFGNGNKDNIYNINQNQSPKIDHITYERQPDGIQHVSQKELRKSFWISCAFFLPCLGFVADIFGVLSFFGIQGAQLSFNIPFEVKTVLFFICAGIVSFNYNKLELFLVSDKETRSSDGRLAEKDAYGNYVTYRMTALCNVPGCSGTVFIRPVPPREEHRCKHIGICDFDGQHTFSVDNNYIGFQKEFDFRRKS